MVLVMAPWPNQPCPHPACAQPITDLLVEMVPDADRTGLEFKAILQQRPGGAITCPYCQGAVEYDRSGNALTASDRIPLRYSRVKMETRAADYGVQRIPPDLSMTPEQWIAEEKLMSGALQGYLYAEDLTP
ncbi:MAG: hypothetical protein HY289_16050 [Planctomycetes bacterium]|nr:hypothetical protein [Planctomycetota bacterium]